MSIFSTLRVSFFEASTDKSRSLVLSNSLPISELDNRKAELAKCSFILSTLLDKFFIN